MTPLDLRRTAGDTWTVSFHFSQPMTGIWLAQVRDGREELVAEFDANYADQILILTCEETQVPAGTYSWQLQNESNTLLGGRFIVDRDVAY